MSFARFLKGTTALIGTLAILSNSAAVSLAQDDRRDEWQQRDDDHHEELSLREKVELLRHKVKYVFVIFHENESFDHYFGTYPGANGLFSAPHGATPANATPSFVQKYLDTSLNTVTISPFLMPQAVISAGHIVPIYPADEISVDHSHQGMSNRRPASRRMTVTRWIKRA
jgi:phospholipase C